MAKRSCDRDSGRLQGPAPAGQAGIERRGSAPADSALREWPRDPCRARRHDRVCSASLGLAASHFGLSAIPAYLFAGIILGPNDPSFIQLVQPSEVTDFVAEIGLIFLLFFLGLEFSVDAARPQRQARRARRGGRPRRSTSAWGSSSASWPSAGASPRSCVAACVYVSSSAIAVKALTDFRRLADDETDLVLAILLFEDIAIAAVLGFVATGGGGAADDCARDDEGAASSSRARSPRRTGSARRSAACSRRLDLEFFLLAVFGFVVGMSALRPLSSTSPRPSAR